jgi:hypothetical protein
MPHLTPACCPQWTDPLLAAEDVAAAMIAMQVRWWRPWPLI